MNRICEEIRNKLIGKNGILSVKASKEFITELETSLKNIVDEIEKTPQAIEMKSKLSPEDYSSWVKEQSNKVLDMKRVKEGLKVAMANQIKTQNKIRMNTEATRKLDSKLTNGINQFLELHQGKTLEQMKNINKLGVNEGIIDKVLDTTVGGVATTKQLVAKDLLKDANTLVEKNGKKFLIDLDGMTSVVDGQRNLEDYLMVREVTNNNVRPENLRVLNGLHEGIKRLDETIKDVFGNSTSFDGIFNHKLLQDTVRNIKRDYISKRSGFGEKVGRFFLDSNNTKVDPVYLKDYKEYLKEWIGNNLLNKDLLSFKNSTEVSEKVQYENAVNFLADALDMQLSKERNIINSTTLKESDKLDLISLSSAFDKYKDFLKDDFKKVGKSAKVDFIDTFNNTIDTVSTRIGLARTLGNNPVENLAKVRKDMNTKFANNGLVLNVLDAELSKMDKLANVIINKNSFVDKHIAVRSMEAIQRKGYAKIMFGLIANQIGDIGSLQIKLASKTNERVATSSLKLANRYTKEVLTDIGDITLKKLGLRDKALKSLSNADKENLLLKTSYYVESLVNNGSFKIANSRTDTSLYKSAVREFQESGVTGAELELASRLGLIDVHSKTMNNISNMMIDDFYESAVKYNDWTNESKAIINGSGFTSGSYDEVMDFIRSKRDYTKKVDTHTEDSIREILNKSSDEELINLYKNFAKKDHETILKLAEQKARVINPFLDKSEDAVFGKLNNEGIDKLFVELRNYEKSKNYKSWVNDEEFVNKLRGITQFPTIVGSDLRVVINPDEFKKLIVNDKFENFIIDGTSFGKNDLDTYIMSLYNNVNVTLNYGYEQAVLRKSQDFIRRTENALLKKNLENDKIINNLFEKEFEKISKDPEYAKRIIDEFRDNINFRVDNMKVYASENSSGQADTLFKSAQYDISDSHFMNKLYVSTGKFLKATSIRNLLGTLESFKFSAMDVYEKGNKEFMKNVGKYSAVVGAGMVFGGISLALGDAMNFEFGEDYVDKDGKLKLGKMSLDMLQNGIYLGAPISERNYLATEIYKPINTAYKIGKTLIAGNDAYWKTTDEQLDFNDRLSYSYKALMYGIYDYELGSRAKNFVENKYLLNKIEDDSIKDYIKNNLE